MTTIPPGFPSSSTTHPSSAPSHPASSHKASTTAPPTRKHTYTATPSPTCGLHFPEEPTGSITDIADKALRLIAAGMDEIASNPSYAQTKLAEAKALISSLSRKESGTLSPSRQTIIDSVKQRASELENGIAAVLKAESVI